jgi:DNA-binding NarL/FixJ family response regulator
VSDAPRVLIADDHAPTRAGVRMALESGGLEVCAEVATAHDAVRAAVAERPDACLIDVQMPGGGIQAVAAIAAELPACRILMLTVSPSVDDLLDALRAGAAGYLLKDMDPGQLPGSVRAALAGEAPMPGRLATRLIEELRHQGGRPTITLNHNRRVVFTPREWDVAELLADGMSTAEIARHLFLSQVTVRRHMSAVLHKLGVSSRDEARRLIERHRASVRPRSSD